MTDSERRLATVVRQAQHDLASFTAHELAVRAKVSDATAVRFFQRLGYASYGEARRQTRDTRNWASPLAQMAGQATHPDQPSGFAGYAAHDCDNLTRTAQAIPEASLQAAIRILEQAAAVHVVGFRNSMMLAGYARTLLTQVRPHVMLLPLAGMTIAEELAGVEPGDALLAIGFRRRPPLLRKIMAATRALDMPSILVADNSATAASRLATVTLQCECTGRGPFDSYAAAISLINYLGASVGHAVGQSSLDRLQRIEDLHIQLGSLDT